MQLFLLYIYTKMDQKPEIVFEPGYHRDKRVILLKFRYNKDLITEVKKL